MYIHLNVHTKKSVYIQKMYIPKKYTYKKKCVICDKSFDLKKLKEKNTKKIEGKNIKDQKLTTEKCPSRGKEIN